ncbi:MAG: nucleotidyltransferase domain-containing protein, partial [Bacteroidota bacterium]
VLSHHQEVEEARILGSRAKGNFKQGSDVDISLKGNNLSIHIAAAIQEELNEETKMPYQFDVLYYDSIENDDLRKHIDRVGIVFYKK